MEGSPLAPPGAAAQDPSSHPLLVIGLGAEFRRDDGVGLIVARELGCLHLPGVRVAETPSGASGLLDLWQGASTVILVDAMRSGRPPGTVARFEAHPGPLPGEIFPPSSTHASACTATTTATAGARAALE